VYDGWSLLEERNASGVEQARYYHGAMIDELLLRITANTYYYHHDGLGSTIALTDSTGALAESYTYDVFGAATILSTNAQLLAVSAVGNRFLFTGREYLAEIGLYDYRNRFYSPSLGRFLQTDPIGFDAGDVNLYRYVGNSTMLLCDPFGTEPVPTMGLPDPRGYKLGATIELSCRDKVDSQKYKSGSATEVIRSRAPLSVFVGRSPRPVEIGEIIVYQRTYTEMTIETWSVGICTYCLVKCDTGCCWEFNRFAPDSNGRLIKDIQTGRVMTEYRTDFEFPDGKHIAQEVITELILHQLEHRVLR
jgi:RHS repeat-associated protein